MNTGRFTRIEAVLRAASFIFCREAVDFACARLLSKLEIDKLAERSEVYKNEYGNYRNSDTLASNPRYSLDPCARGYKKYCEKQMSFFVSMH